MITTLATSQSSWNKHWLRHIEGMSWKLRNSLETLKNTKLQLKTLETMKFSWIQNAGMYIQNGNHIHGFSCILSVSPLPNFTNIQSNSPHFELMTILMKTQTTSQVAIGSYIMLKSLLMHLSEIPNVIT
jgi:hypothetical protein